MDTSSSEGKKRYRKKVSAAITAVQINLDTTGFSYTKWGGPQHCKPGDWLVNNQGECYTVDQVSFAETYKQISPGVYLKTRPVWAEVATEAGSVRTKEGESDYVRGDYLVCNHADGTDPYTVPREIFEANYQLDEP